MKWILCFFLALLNMPAVADQNDYKRYQANLEGCKKRIETRLLESPDFGGDVWTAKNRADVACRNRLGRAPEKFASYEKEFATRVNLISPKSWSFESIIDGASALAEKHQSSFLGLDNSYGLLDQVNEIIDLLVSRNMACHSGDVGSVADMVDRMEESRTEKYKKCESEIRKAVADYVRSYNEHSD